MAVLGRCPIRSYPCGEHLRGSGIVINGVFSQSNHPLPRCIIDSATSEPHSIGSGVRTS